jgi:hypothetical protein
MRESAVVTLAVGETYAKWACDLLQALAAAGNAVLVVTDQPQVFQGTSIEAVSYVPETAHVWHAKRQALAAGLERAHTVYFVDADHRARGVPMGALPRLPVGAAHTRLNRFPLGAIRFNWLTDGGNPPIPALDEAAEHMGVADWRSLLWWGDTLFAVSRDEGDAWCAFLAAWDRFAAFAVGKATPHPLVLGDGVAMAFAAHLCGWAPHEASAVTELAESLAHLAHGSWRKP